MYRQCTTEKSAQQQRQLEACLLSLMQRQDYHQISVSSLCELAGLSRKTFYRLFGSKDDALCALIDHTLMDYAKFRLPQEALLPDAPAELQRFFAYWHHHKPLLDVLQGNQLGSLLLQRTIEHVTREEFGALRWLGALNQPEALDKVTFYITGIMSLILSWHLSGYARSPSEMSALLLDLMLHAPISQMEALKLF